MKASNRAQNNLRIVSLLIIISLLLVGCTSRRPLTSIILQPGTTTIEVPTGFTFVSQVNDTVYVRNNETSRVYTLDNGIVAREVVLPARYELVSISSVDNSPIYYCRNQATGQITTCTVILL